MKEMIYKFDEEKGCEILDMGKYKGRDYVIISNFGRFPCAYVQTDVDFYTQQDFTEPAHCGFTFYSLLSHLERFNKLSEEQKKILSRNFVGWDYGHSEDYSDFGITSWEGKKWTTEEILENVKEVIDWIIIKEEKDYVI